MPERLEIGQPYRGRVPEGAALEGMRGVFQGLIDWKIMDIDKPITVEAAKPLVQVIREATDEHSSFGELVRSTGIDKGYLSKIINGKVAPSLDTVNMLADALKLSRFDCLLASGFITFAPEIQNLPDAKRTAKILIDTKRNTLHGRIEG